MNTADLLAILASVLAMLLPAMVLGLLRKGRASLGGFILGGRRLPWWLGGAAMVAGGTNADSALHQSGKICRDGLPGAWFYWSQIFGAVWHALVFSRLWRRLEINTAVEFYEVRYAGRGAVLARVWSMLFSSLVESVVGLALGLLAMIKVCEVFFHPDATIAVLGAPMPFPLFVAIASVSLGIVYSVVAGLVGVVAGDMIEFVLAITGSYVLMYYVYRETGFAAGLRAGFEQNGQGGLLALLPPGSWSFIALLLIQPFATLAGNTSLNQRFLAMRDEKQAMFSGIWRIVTTYFVRSWPWYICGLCSLLLLPQGVEASENTYPILIARYLPHGLQGFVLSSLIITFMGAVGTLMHNFASVFVNDFYRLYVRRDASGLHYVWVMRITMLLTAAGATVVALASDRILALLKIILIMSAASGTVMFARWHWWRVNVWADLAAQALSLPATLFFTFGPGRLLVTHCTTALGLASEDAVYTGTFLFSVTTVAAAWLIAMFCTKPEPAEKLGDFFARARPYGFWGPVAAACPGVRVTDRFRTDAARYGYGIATCLGCLFGFGGLLLGNPLLAATLLAIAAAAGIRLVRSIQAIHENE